MHKCETEAAPQRLLAAQHRVTPLAPRLCILRRADRLTVLTDIGCGLATAGGRRLYGDTADLLRAPSGVRIWIAEHGRRRLYPTAMPDYATAEREYLCGRRNVQLSTEEAVFFARRDGLEITERVRLCDEGEQRRLQLRNRSGRAREIMVCAAVEPVFDGRTRRQPDAVYRENDVQLLGLQLLDPPEGVQSSGGARLRLRWPLLLPPDGEWQGTLLVVTGYSPTDAAYPPPTEPLLPSERVQLCARLYPRRGSAAYIQATEQLLEDPPPADVPLPAVPFFRFELRQKRELPLLQAYLARLTRWQREGIPTGLAVACAPEWEEAARRLSREFSQVEMVTALLEEEPPLWRALCRWDVRRDRRLPAAVAVAFTPLPLKALSGGSLRRTPPLPAPPFIAPDSEWLLLKYEGALISLLHGHAGESGTLTDRLGTLRVTVRGQQTENRRRWEVTVTSRASLPQSLTLAYYIEPQLLPDPQLRCLTLSHWEEDSGTLTLRHPLLPDRRLMLTATDGADSFDCDRAAFWMGEWGGRRPCPLRFPGASITCTRRLPPRCRETVTFEMKIE